jgi:hypothetical protein
MWCLCILLQQMVGKPHRFQVGGMRQSTGWIHPRATQTPKAPTFRVKWIITMIIFIPAIVHQALAKMTCSPTAIIYRYMIVIDTIYRFQTLWPTEIQNMVTWILAKARFICHTNVHELFSYFPCCSIVVLKINVRVPVSICSDWNCGTYCNSGGLVLVARVAAVR